MEEDDSSDDDIEMEQTLSSWGYRAKEVARFGKLLPCYHCLRLRKSHEHFHNKRLTQVARLSAELAQTNQQAPNAMPTRRCVDCFIQSADYLNDFGGRWVRTNTSWHALTWIAICRSCNTKVSSHRKPPERQRRVDLCDDCFHDSHGQWFQFKNELSRKESDIRQQIMDLQRNAGVLQEYRHWMRSVDEGSSVVANRPADLEDTTMPNWEDIRPDAVARLPGRNGSRRPLRRV